MQRTAHIVAPNIIHKLITNYLAPSIMSNIPTFVIFIDVKKRFFTFFYFGHVFYVFLFSKRFFYLKNVGKVQSGKQINKKHFQNNSNKIDL